MNAPPASIRTKIRNFALLQTIRTFVIKGDCPRLRSEMRLAKAWLIALAVLATAGHAQVTNAGDKQPPQIEAEAQVGEGDWGNIGWKVGTSHTNVLRLGNKFQLSGVGDSVKDDEWLRLFDVGNRGFYGGLAAGKLWGKMVISSKLQF